MWYYSDTRGKAAIFVCVFCLVIMNISAVCNAKSLCFLFEQFGVWNYTLPSRLPDIMSERKNFLQEGRYNVLLVSHENNGFSWLLELEIAVEFLYIMVLQKLLDVLDELEKLKPQVRQWLDELDEVNTTTQMHQSDGPNKISYAFSVNNKASLSYSNVQVLNTIFLCFPMPTRCILFFMYFMKLFAVNLLVCTLRESRKKKLSTKMFIWSINSNFLPYFFSFI